MNKILGIFGLLIFVCLFTTVLTESFDTPVNLYNVARRSALHGIIAIGVSFVIVTGGIDLSIGSVICLCGVLLSVFIMDYGWSVYFATQMVLWISLLIGLLHGVLITKLKLQPFVVTLCGLLVYRGLARWYVADRPQGFGQVHDDGFRLLASGRPWKGYECDLAFFFGIVGAAAAVFCLARVLFGSRDSDGVKAKTWWIAFVFSALFGLIGASELIPAQFRVLNVAGLRIALEPRSLLYYAGLLLFVPSVLAFIWKGLQADFGRAILPTIVVALLACVFTVVALSVAPTFGKISPGETEYFHWGVITAQGSTIRNIIMTTVFVATAALMGGIGWLANVVTSTTEKAALPLLLTVIISGVMWLMGMTNLPTTPLPMPVLILIGCAIVASVFLNQTIYGRYLLALGRNEEAARYSGINTDRMTILAYVICAGMAGLGAILFAVEINNIQPANHGNIYELYAIAGAVLGGCSLRGGEGSILGVIIGAAVMVVLYNSINTLGIDTKLEWVVIGIVILTGVVADEVVKRFVATKRASLQADA